MQEGHSRPTIEDETAEITVYVRVLEDPTGVLWHNFVKYVVVVAEYGDLSVPPAMIQRKKPDLLDSKIKVPRAI